MGVGASVGGCCGAAPRRSIGSLERDRVNQLLDRWHHCDVELLRRKFIAVAGPAAKVNRRLFPQLFSLPPFVPPWAIDVFFAVFDPNQDGFVDFREFCCTLSICCLGSRREKLDMVMQLFDGNNDGRLTAPELDVLLRLVFHCTNPQVTDAQASNTWVHEMAALVGEPPISRAKVLGLPNTKLDLVTALGVLELVPSPQRERASCKQSLSSAELVAGSTWYIIPFAWWEEWKTYVGFDLEQGVEPEMLSHDAWSSTVSDASQIPGTPSAAVAGPLQSLVRTDRPGPIDCSELEHASVAGALRPGLQLERDIVAVPPDVWHRLVEVYGTDGGPTFKRQAVSTDGDCTIDLYPPVFTVFQCSVDGRAVRGSDTSVFLTSKSDGTLHDRLAAELPNVKPAEVRFWMQELPAHPEWVVLERTRTSLPPTATRFMYEQQLPDGSFVRDGLKAGAAFRLFQLHDLLDAKDYQNHWFGCSVVGFFATTAGGHAHACQPDRATHIKVHFEGFSSRYDELVTVQSANLAPWGTYSMHVPARDPLNATVQRELPRGCLGLDNLGNTCFMNSIVQCLSNTPMLRDYLVTEAYHNDINRSNRMGSGGRMAESLADLVARLWADETGSVRPDAFKSVLGRVKPEFRGYEQHDAQELLAALLDSIHEDLNQANFDGTQIQDEEPQNGPAAPSNNPNAVQPASGVSDAVGSGGATGTVSEASTSAVESKAEVVLPAATGMPGSTEATAVSHQEADPTSVDASYITPRRGGPPGPPGSTASLSQVPLSLSGGRLGRTFSYSSGGRDFSARELFPTSVDDLRAEAKLASRMWRAHLARHQSVIVDLFHGMLRSSTRCPVCHHSSNVYDPFMYLSLPLPIPSETSVVVRVIPVALAEDGLAWAPMPDSVAPAKVQHARSADDVASPSEGANQSQPESRSGDEAGAAGSALDASAPQELLRPATAPSEPDRPKTPPPLSYHHSHEGPVVPAVYQYGLVMQLQSQVLSVKERLLNVMDRPLQCVRPPADAFIIVEVAQHRLVRVFHDTTEARELTHGGVAVAFERPRAVSDIVGHPPPVEPEVPIQTGRAFSDFQVGDRCDAQDFQGNWFASTVVKMNAAKRTVTVHFDRYASTWDEEIPVDSPRLAVIRSKVPQDKETVTQVTVMHRYRKRLADGSEVLELFGEPFVLFYSTLLTCSQVHKLLRIQTRRFVSKAFANHPPMDLFSVKYANGAGTACTRCKNRCSGCALPLDDSDPRIRPREALVLDWVSFEAYRDTAPDVVDHPSVIRSKLVAEETARYLRDGIPLSHCLDAFTRAETLGEGEQWKCDKCNAPRRGVKNISLWSLPDILVVHLKRFHYNQYYGRKIDVFVDFPLRSLDLDAWCSGSRFGLRQSNVYDLYGVINHTGTLGGGHYTAFCHNTAAEKHRWYWFNDSSVQELSRTRVVSELAYCLFYRRRHLSPHNVVNFSAPNGI